MVYYINKNNGNVIDWNPEDGILIDSVWVKLCDWLGIELPYTLGEPDFDNNDNDDDVEAINPEEETEEVIIPEEEQSVQVYSSVKVLEAEAPKEHPATTKAGNTYEYNGKKWVKTNV